MRRFPRFQVRGDRRGIPQQHELLPPPEVPRLRPLLKRLPEPVPSWSGWERRAGLTWPTMTSAIFAGQHPGGLVVACLGLRGGWKDDALTLLRQESERLLPGRHRWLLHDVGAADLVVLCGEWNWLACSLPMERERREELDGCLARLGLLRDLAVALMQGLAIPQPFPGAPLPPAPHPPQGAAEVAAAGRLLCTPRPLPRGRLPDSPGWFELPEDLLEHHANDLMGKLRWDRTAVKLSANIDRLAELSQGPKRP
jgi:hypothetical protein